MIDSSKQFPDLMRRVQSVVTGAFPIESKEHVMALDNVRWEDFGPSVENNISLQKEYKVKEKTLAAKLIGTITIKDKRGHTVDRQTGFILVTLPHITCRTSYIVEGNELQTVNQLRLRPGPYTRYTSTNDTETFINAAGGGYRVVFLRETGIFRLKSGTTIVDLYPVLHALGVSDVDLGNAWGSEVLEANQDKTDRDSVRKLYQSMRRYAEMPTDASVLNTEVTSFFASKALDPAISRITLGKEFTSITPQLLVESSKKAIALAQEHVEPDDTESLAFKSIHAVEDFVPERLAKVVPSVVREISTRMDRGIEGPKIARLISPSTFSNPVIDWFKTSEFTRYSDQHNPIDIASTNQLTTTMGEGGIQSEHAITDPLRLVHPSQMGFLDGTHSPEGCFGPASEVYTSVGWVRWDSVTPKHRIACLVRGSLRYARPRKLISYHYSGRMIGYKSDRIEFFVTPNHRMWVRPHACGARYRMVSAGSLLGKNRSVRSGSHGPIPGTTSYFMPPTVEADGKDLQKPGNPPIGAHLNPPVPPIDIIDWCRFLGWYLSEGNAHGKYVTMITQLHTSKDECSHIEMTLNRLPFKWCRSGDRRFQISGKQLNVYCRTLGKSRTKHVPPEVFSAPPDARLAFLEAAFMGDGRKRTIGKGERGSNPLSRWECYCTTSRRLADDVYRLMFELGLSSSIAFEPDLRNPKYLGCYCVHVHSFNERQLTSKSSRHPEGLFYTADYDGTVHCASVPGGLMFCRHGDGMGFWIGNSKIGVTGHLSVAAEKEGNFLTIRVFDAKTGKKVQKNTQELEMATIAFFDQFNLSGPVPKPVSPMVKARNRSKIELVPAKSVDYIFQDPKSFFSVVTNSIPFLHNNSPNRVLMADRHIEQAVALANPDPPLVQARYSGNEGYHDFFGRFMNMRSPVDGVVERIGKEEIKIKGMDRAVHIVNLHYLYPLNSEAFLTDTPLVKAGDRVKKGQVIANNNFSKGGTLAIGKDLITAYMPYKGQNFEDAIVISEGASKRMTSEHKYEFRFDRTVTSKIGFKTWQAHFPDKAAEMTSGSYDPDGVIKKGVTIPPKTVVIPAVDQIQFQEEMDYAKIHKSLANPFRDVSVAWDGEYPAEVVDVVKTGKFIKVFLRTLETTQVGDKLSNRSGGKGIVTQIIPDKEMYKDSKGQTIDVIFNPAGIAGRINPGQMFEASAGKIAEKTGKKYLVDNFSSESSLKKVQNDLKAAGLTDTETLYDPVENKKIDDIFVGRVNFMKLKHQVRHKFSAKALGPYSSDMQPAKISGESAQNIGTGEIYALLGGGSTHFLKDAMSLKSSSNPEYWRAWQMGLPTPPPKSPFILDKLVTYLEGAGINLKQEGTQFKALPLTDKDILSRSNGAITNPSVVRASDLKPEPGGLFDRGVTGGFGGVSWSHIDLESSIPNPLMERPIISVTGISSSQFKSIMGGETFVTKDGKLTVDPSMGRAAGDGIKRLLDRVDVDAQLNETIVKIRTARASTLDDLNRKRRYLQALKALKMGPSEAYLWSKVPVIPPQFRPIYPLPDGALNVADPNHCYREILLINNQLQDLKKQGVDPKNLAPLRSSLYGAVQGMAGVTEPLTRAKNFKGFIATVKGQTNKFGLFQGRAVRRPQDLSGRSTVIPNPALGIDEVGLPVDMALMIYRPFVVRSLVGAGLTPNEALDLIEKKDSRVMDVLRAEIKDRPVYLNRAPTLHKFSMLPFRPMLVTGQAIHTNPLINAGLNMDYDGDQQYIHVVAFLSESAILKAKELMGNSFVEDRRMTARLNLTIPAMKDGDVFMFHLEDFPVGKKINTTRGKKGLIEWYAAIPGTRVVAYDDKAGKAVWADVTLWSKHLDRLVETVELESGRQLFVDDDPRAVYGLEAGSLGFVRRSPADAVRAKMWVPRVSEIEEASGGSTWMPVFESGGRLHLNGSIDLDFDFGYLVGSTAGDGWGVHAHETTRGISIAYGEGGEPVVDRCDTIISRMFSEDAPEKNLHDSGEYGTSWVATWSSTELGSLIGGLIGRGAENKHLPPFFMSAPLAFRKGLFAGLMDTDGSVAISHAKKKPQLMANASSKSLRLLQEAGLLAASLSIASRITPSKTPAGLPFWVLGFCGPDIKRWGGEGMVHPGKLKAFAEAKDIDDSHIAPRSDIVPITESLASFIYSAIPATRSASKKQKSLYMVFRNARSRLSIARGVVDDLLRVIPKEKILEHPDGTRWLSIVSNRKIKWDRVTSFTKTGIRQTGHDLTVPGYETFMSVDGVILSNTVGIHTVISEAARKEAMDKLPSKNLLSVSSDSLMHAPSKEYVLGLYLMTEPKGSPAAAASLKDMMALYGRKAIKVNTPVMVKGEGIWTPGRLIVNDSFPVGFKPGNVTMTGKIMKEALYKIAKEKPNEAGSVINRLKDLGAKYVTEVGFSVGLKDLEFDYKARDKVLAEAAGKVKGIGFDKAYLEAVDKLNAQVKGMKDNRFVIGGILSGAFGKADQMTQMLAAPVAMTDHKDQIIQVPIKKSFAEGHDIAAYWSTLPGSRKGLMQKGLGTRDVGALSKRLVNTTIDQTISMADCGSTDGLVFPVESRETLDRVVSDGPFKGKVMTPELVQKLRTRKTSVIKMRSPLKCKAIRGICQKCYGLDETGQFPAIGFHIGALVGQTVTEPVLQTMLRGFHTGGAVGRSAVGFDRIEQIYEMPENLPGKATLSSVSGSVSSVKKGLGGGWDVTVGNEGHFVPKETGLGVKKGDKVVAGQKLSATGVIKPQELLSITGDIHRVRAHLISDLQKEYSSGGIRMKQKIFETVIKPMTDRAEVTDAGDGEKFHVYRGDIISVNTIDEINKKIGKGRKVLYQSTLLPIRVSPYHGDDLFGKLMFERLHETLQRAPATLEKADTAKGHPITRVAFGGYKRP